MKEKENSNWFERHKLLSIVLAIVMVGIFYGVVSGASNRNTNVAISNSSQNTNDRKKQSAVAKIGQSARDGKFEFIVNSVKCGETTVGSDYLKTDAQGQFCRLSLSVKNIGDKSQSLLADDQKLVNSQGQEYSYSSTGTIYAASSGSMSTWYNDINPGNSVNGEILFDLPKDQTPVTAILHDSAFSGGVKVSLQ